MQLSVLCTDKKLEENFWYAFEKNLYHFKNNSKENRASIERFSKIQNFFFFIIIHLHYLLDQGLT